jgi:hypothetical protein
VKAATDKEGRNVPKTQAPKAPKFPMDLIIEAWEEPCDDDWDINVAAINLTEDNIGIDIYSDQSQKELQSKEKRGPTQVDHQRSPQSMDNIVAWMSVTEDATFSISNSQGVEQLLTKTGGAAPATSTTTTEKEGSRTKAAELIRAERLNVELKRALLSNLGNQSMSLRSDFAARKNKVLRPHIQERLKGNSSVSNALMQSYLHHWKEQHQQSAQEASHGKESIALSADHIKFWNAWIRCLVDEERRKKDESKGGGETTPRDGVLAAEAAEMSESILDYMIRANSSDIENGEEGEPNHVGSPFLAGGISPSILSPDMIPPPDLDTFHTVMEHWICNECLPLVPTRPRAIYEKLLAFRATFSGVDEYSKQRRMELTPTPRTFQLLAQSRTYSPMSLRQKIKWVREMKDFLEEAGIDLDRLDLIEVFNAHLKHSGPSSRQSPTNGLASNPNYTLVEPWGRKQNSNLIHAQEAEAWLEWMIKMYENDNESDMDGVADIVPPPNAATFECIMQASVRTGNITGLLKAQEWFHRLTRYHDQASKVEGGDERLRQWFKPTLSTLHPIVGSWVYRASTSDPTPECDDSIYAPLVVEDWLKRCDEVSKPDSISEDKKEEVDCYKELQPNSILMAAPIAAWMNKVENPVKLQSNPFVAKRCLEWLKILIDKHGESSNERRHDRYPHPSAFAYTLDAIYSEGQRKSRLECAPLFEEVLALLEQILAASKATNKPGAEKNLEYATALPSILALYANRLRRIKEIPDGRKSKMLKRSVDLVSQYYSEAAAGAHEDLQQLCAVGTCNDVGNQGVLEDSTIFSYTPHSGSLGQRCDQSWPHRAAAANITAGRHTFHFFWKEVARYCRQNRSTAVGSLEYETKMSIILIMVETLRKENQEYSDANSDKSPLFLEILVTLRTLPFENPAERVEMMRTVAKLATHCNWDDKKKFFDEVHRASFIRS